MSLRLTAVFAIRRTEYSSKVSRLSFIRFPGSRARRFEKCVRPHLSSLYRFAYRLTGQRDDAEDLVQDVLVKLYPRADEVLTLERPGPWLRKVLYRQFVDDRRRDSRAPFIRRELGEDNESYDRLMQLVEGGVRPDFALEGDQLRRVMREILDSLPAEQSALLLLHDVDGWRQEDIAMVMDIAVGTVKSRLHRCRLALRERMAQQLEPSGAAKRVRG